MAYCQPHLERTGEEVIATHWVNDEPFCKSCFLGGTPGGPPRSRRRTYGIDMALVTQLYQTGTVAQVAAQLGISRCTVYRCLRIQGCQRRRPGRPKKCEGPSESSTAQGGMPGQKRSDCWHKGLPKEHIEKMICGGMRTAEIARQLNVSTGTIRYYRERFEDSGLHSGRPTAEGRPECNVNLNEQGQRI